MENDSSSPFSKSPSIKKVNALEGNTINNPNTQENYDSSSSSSDYKSTFTSIDLSNDSF